MAKALIILLSPTVTVNGWPVTVKWTPRSLEPRLSCQWKVIPQCQLSYGLTEKIPQNSRCVPLDLSTMASVMMSSFWELQSTQTFSWQSSWWWKLLRLLSPTAQWIICGWISRDEGIHVWWDEGQIMKVINLKKQPKNSKFYSLVSFTKAPEKPWKRKHSSDCFVGIIWLLCLPTFLHSRMRPKVTILICNEKKNQIFICCGNISWINISI